MSITVFRFRPAWGTLDISPFCIKVLTYLTMTGIDHTTEVGNPMLAPRKKLPYIIDAGVKVADSTAIVAYLVGKYGDPLDADLSPRERVLGTVFQSLLEEHLYFVILYYRWIDPDGWARYRAVLAEYARSIGVRGPLCPALVWHARRTSRKQLHFQGLGRHSPTEIAAIGIRLVDAIAGQLADSPFFLGARPRSIDASVFALLSALLGPPMDNPVRRHAADIPTLAAYIARMQARYGLEA